MDNLEENNAMKIVIFTQAEEMADYFDKFSNRMSDVPCVLDVCSYKVTTEEILLRHAPHLIFVDFTNMEEEEQVSFINKLEKVASMIPLVGIFSESQKMLALDYMKKGLRDYIEYPFKEFEVQKVFKRFQREAGAAKLKRTGRVYTFFSFKGGVGNTFVAVNTAINLARVSKKKVLLWDMALQAGDIPFFLNHQPDYTLFDIVENIEQIDENYLQGVLTPHSSGVSILPAPNRIEEIERLAPATMEKVLDLFLGYFDHIIVDGGYRITDPLIPIIDQSTYLFIPSTLELISLRSASRCLELLDQLNYSPEKIKIIVNRFNSKHEAISVDKAKEILRYTLAQFIENDYEAASQSVNLGQAVIDAAPQSRLNKQFLELATKIHNNFGTEEKNKRLFSRVSHALKKVLGNVA